MDDTDKKQIEEVLKFWFEEVTPKQRWAKDGAFDKLIRDRFVKIYWRVMNGETDNFKESASGRLAQIIVLDQFSRNMFREDKQSFAGDELALKYAKEAVKVGADKEIELDRRMSVYMPYMHSESKKIHQEALSLFEQFVEDGGNEEGLKYEKIHKNIIDRFGRYPHRNKILGRKSTDEEFEFLKEHSGF